MMPLPLAAAWLALAAAPAAPEARPTRCEYPTFLWARDVEAAYLLGTATPDTVLAGPGSVEPGTGPGHLGSGVERPIHGQVIRVERFGGADSTALALALGGRNLEDVVIVPWDYAENCQPASWSRSARWVPVGEAGVYSVYLRSERDWVQGLPTFDAFVAEREPYPLGIAFRGLHRDPAVPAPQSWLTAAEYFELRRAWPDQGLIDQRPAAAAAALDRWEQAHPELAGKYPATELLPWVRWIIERRRQPGSSGGPAADVIQR